MKKKNYRQIIDLFIFPINIIFKLPLVYRHDRFLILKYNLFTKIFRLYQMTCNISKIEMLKIHLTLTYVENQIDFIDVMLLSLSFGLLYFAYHL